MAGQCAKLENIIERAMIVTEGETLEVDPLSLNDSGEGRRFDGAAGLVEVERQTIVDALARCRGKVYGPKGRGRRIGP